MSPSSSPFNRPLSPPPNTQPSVLAWQGSPNHALRAQILAAARSRPENSYPTQRPLSPPPIRAVPQQLKPRRTSSILSNPGTSCGSSTRRPRHNGSASSSTSSASSLLSARSANALGGPAVDAMASGAGRATLAVKPAVAQHGGFGAVGPSTSLVHAGDENSWDLAQILSEVDARMAARRGTPFPSVGPPAAASAHRAAKDKGRALQRSVSADRLPFSSSAGRNRKSNAGVGRRLDDVAEDPRPNDSHHSVEPPASKRLKRSTSSGTALTRRRSRSPSWEVEEPSSGSAYDDGIDWKRTVQLLTPPAAAVLHSRPIVLTAHQPAGLPSLVGPAPAPAPLHTRSPPKARSAVSPQKRKVPPSPLKQATSMDYSISSPTVPHLAMSQDRAPNSQIGGVRLGMGRATSAVIGSSGIGRVTRFRPPFKPPSQVAAPAPAPIGRVPASPRPLVATQSVILGEEMADEDTSFDSFDGMLASLEGSGQLNEVYRLLDGG